MPTPNPFPPYPAPIPPVPPVISPLPPPSTASCTNYVSASYAVSAARIPRWKVKELSGGSFDIVCRGDVVVESGTWHIPEYIKYTSPPTELFPCRLKLSYTFRQTPEHRFIDLAFREVGYTSGSGTSGTSDTSDTSDTSENFNIPYIPYIPPLPPLPPF